MLKRIYKRVIEKMLSVEIIYGPRGENIDYLIINIIVRKSRIHANKSYYRFQ